MILQMLIQLDNQTEMREVLSFFLHFRSHSCSGNDNNIWLEMAQSSSSHVAQVSCPIRSRYLWLLNLLRMELGHLDFPPATCSHASTTCLICKQSYRDSNSQVPTNEKDKYSFSPILVHYPILTVHFPKKGWSRWPLWYLQTWYSMIDSIIETGSSSGQ